MPTRGLSIVARGVGHHKVRVILPWPNRGDQHLGGDVLELVASTSIAKDPNPGTHEGTLLLRETTSVRGGLGGGACVPCHCVGGDGSGGNPQGG